MPDTAIGVARCPLSKQVCSPTRTAIMTGRYPHRNGMQTPFCGGMAEGLNLNETMMSEYMNSVGYVSQIVGKWQVWQSHIMRGLCSNTP